MTNSDTIWNEMSAIIFFFFTASEIFWPDFTLSDHTLWTCDEKFWHYMKYLSSLQNMCMLKKYFLLHQKNLCQIEFWICKILHSHPSGTSKRIFLVNKLAINTSPQLIPEIYEDLQCFSPTLKMKTKLVYLFPTLSILKVTHL